MVDLRIIYKTQCKTFLSYTFDTNQFLNDMVLWGGVKSTFK